MSQQPSPQLTTKEISLQEDEATKLASELKSELQKGNVPKANKQRIQLIIAGLGDKRGLIRRTFVESLGVIGKSTVPALRNALLHHSNVIVRRSAAKALKLTADPSALPDLLQALITDEDPVVQGSSAGAMAIFGEKAVEHLLKVLINPSSTAMQCGLATWGLSFIGAEAPYALRKAAQSHNVIVKAAAIAALGEQIQAFNDEKAKQIVLNALYDPSIEVRSEATILLGKFQGENWAKSLLIDKLMDTSSYVRKNAALSLMTLKAVDSINDLKKILIIEEDIDVINILHLAINQLAKEKQCKAID